MHATNIFFSIWVNIKKLTSTNDNTGNGSLGKGTDILKARLNIELESIMASTV